MEEIYLELEKFNTRWNIKINDEEVSIPLKVIKDFISNNKAYRIKVDIPE